MVVQEINVPRKLVISVRPEKSGHSVNVRVSGRPDKSRGRPGFQINKAPAETARFVPAEITLMIDSISKKHELFYNSRLRVPGLRKLFLRENVQKDIQAHTHSFIFRGHEGFIGTFDEFCKVSDKKGFFKSVDSPALRTTVLELDKRCDSVIFACSALKHDEVKAVSGRRKKPTPEMSLKGLWGERIGNEAVKYSTPLKLLNYLARGGT